MIISLRSPFLSPFGIHSMNHSNFFFLVQNKTWSWNDHEYDILIHDNFFSSSAKQQCKKTFYLHTAEQLEKKSHTFTPSVWRVFLEVVHGDSNLAAHIQQRSRIATWDMKNNFWLQNRRQCCNNVGVERRPNRAFMCICGRDYMHCSLPSFNFGYNSLLKTFETVTILQILTLKSTKCCCCFLTSFGKYMVNKRVIVWVYFLGLWISKNCHFHVPLIAACRVDLNMINGRQERER